MDQDGVPRMRRTGGSAARQTGVPRMRRKYLSLGVGELAAAAVFAYIAAILVFPRLDPGDARRALASALAPLLAILLQAGAYWLLARSWVGRAPMPHIIARLYRIARAADPLLLTAGLIGLIAWFPTGPGAVLAIAVWLGGVIEYVNYFVVRLSYPPRRWASLVAQGRTPRLVRDLARAETRAERGLRVSA